MNIKNHYNMVLDLPREVHSQKIRDKILEVKTDEAVHVLLPGVLESYYLLKHQAGELHIQIEILEGNDNVSATVISNMGSNDSIIFSTDNLSFKTSLAQGEYNIELQSPSRVVYRITIMGADDVWQKQVWLTDKGTGAFSEPITYLTTASQGVAEIQLFDCSEGAFLLAISGGFHGVPDVQFRVQPGDIIGDGSKEMGGAGRWRTHAIYTADTEGAWLFMPSIINAAGDYALRGDPNSDMGDVEFHWVKASDAIRERFFDYSTMRLSKLKSRKEKIDENSRIKIYEDAIQRGLKFIKSLLCKAKDGHSVHQRWYADINSRRYMWATEGNLIIARTFYQTSQRLDNHEYNEMAISIAKKFTQYQNLDKNSPSYGMLAYCLEEELEDIFSTYHAPFTRDIRKMVEKLWNVKAQENPFWGSSCHIQGKSLYGLAELVYLSNDQHLRKVLRLVADYYVSVQYDSGQYEGRWPHYVEAQPYSSCGYQTCMGVAGLIYAYKSFNDAKYLESAERALAAFMRDTYANGSIATYCTHMSPKETALPVRSSMNMLTPFALAYEVTKNIIYRQALDGLHDYLSSLQRDSGMIIGSEQSCINLYYNQNWGPQGFALAYEATKDEKFFNTGIMLTDALVRIQLIDDDPHYDGAWTGSFNIDKNLPGGWVDDEGNCTDLYTGWTAGTLVYGIQKFIQMIQAH